MRRSSARSRSVRRALAGPAVVALAAGGFAGAASAQPEQGGAPRPLHHTGTFAVPDNLRAGEADDTPTSAEIVDFTPGGDGLVYTDAFTGRLGVVDVSDPSAPAAGGAIDLPGGPTSVAVHRRWALVAVVTSADPDGDGPLNELDAPTGSLLVIDLASRAVVRTIELAGQPDSIAVAPSGRYAAIVIENERDEEQDDGLLPQPPAGSLQVLDLDGQPNRWGLRTVALTGLADVAPDDPEPEYVDINDRDRAVVSLQENNHLVLVNLRTAEVTADFPAGTADVEDVDTVEEELGPQGNGIITLDGSLQDRRREPDAVAWIDRNTFATANEGDYEDATGAEGGSRSFTLFNVDGSVEYEAGSSLEHELVRAGHYPEGRSEDKGTEPEGLEVANHRGRTYLFVAAERANAVAVYDVTGAGPQFLQILPTGIGPEGLTFSHGVLAVTSEVDGADEGFLARPLITLFQFGRGPAQYPFIESADVGGLPVPWVALSGLSGDPDDASTAWAVSDSVLAQAYLYRLDISSTPAVIRERIPVGGTDVDDQRLGDYDLEGVAARREGGFWLASEGRTTSGSSRPNLLVRAGSDGTVLDAVELPPALASGATSSGFEGVAVTGSAAGGDEVVWVAFQGDWSDDPDGLAKIGRYDVATEAWTFARYPLDPPTGGATVGLSELTVLPDGRFAVIERDNQLGDLARTKRIYGIDPRSVTFAPFGGPLPVLGKELLRDALPDLAGASITVPDKLEGMAVTADQRVLLVTDNDGVDENYGETVFLDLGPVGEVLAPK